jgi:DeoR/GlpR family transcriptional regulator of sugar metabolism
MKDEAAMAKGPTMMKGAGQGRALSGVHGGPLIPDQRRERLLDLLRSQPVLSVHQLTDLLGVSHMTVRRDIAVLEREGRAHSVPGGVRIANQLRSEPSYVDKSIVDLPEKRGMAREASALVEEDMTVYLDAGTTMLSMVPFLAEYRFLTILTNDFTTVSNLIEAEHLQLVHVGGQVEHKNRSTVGRLAAATLRRVNIDLAFISASSWDLHRGVTTPTESKVDVKQAAMEVATRSVLVSGSSKYGTFSMHRIAALREFATIVTDTQLPEAAKESLSGLGPRLVLAQPED